MARLAFGDPTKVLDTVAASGTDLERGAFLAPILLRCDLRCDDLTVASVGTLPG